MFPSSNKEIFYFVVGAVCWLMKRLIQIRRYLLQRGGLFYPHILCNSFSNQPQRLFSQTTTRISTTKSCFTLFRESPLLVHVLSNVARISIRAQSEFHYGIIIISVVCLVHFPKLEFLFSHQTLNTVSDQDQRYSSLVNAFMEKKQRLESDFQRYNQAVNCISKDYVSQV